MYNNYKDLIDSTENYWYVDIFQVNYIVKSQIFYTIALYLICCLYENIEILNFDKIIQ